MEMEFTRRGQGNLNTVLGAIGTAGAVGLLNGNGNGILGNLFGGGKCNSNSDYMPITHYEMGLIQSNNALSSENSLLKADKYTDQKFAEFNDRYSARFNNIEAQLAAQAVHNATNDAVLGCLQGQVTQLMGLTKLVIPNTSVCPGWGNVTVAPATITAGA